MRIQPTQTLSQLESLTAEELDRLARQAIRQLSTRKLLVGRCLHALDQQNRARKLGCSGSVHYARLLGIPRREAMEVRRVARRLEELPLLRGAAEEGIVPWASLREIVSKATKETEARWLELAGKHRSGMIQKLVRATKRGEMPGDPALAAELVPLEVTMRFLTSTIGAALMDKIVRELGEKFGGAMSLGYLTGAATPEARDRCTAEVLKDVAAAAESAPAESAELPARVNLRLWKNPRVRFNPNHRLAPAQRRELLRRDGYACSTPGCPHRLWLDVHHIIYFSEGGPSLPHNLLTLCSTCHRNLHEGWLKVGGEAPLELWWMDGEGEPLVRPRLNELQPEEQKLPPRNLEQLYQSADEADEPGLEGL